MSNWLVVGVSVAYLISGAANLAEGKWQMAGLLITYAVANLFLIAINVRT